MSGLDIVETERGRRFATGRLAVEIGRNGSLAGWTWDGRALIYVSPRSLPDRRLRGGMPVCWPWFGAAPAEGLPPHGFLLDGALDFSAARAGADGLAVTLSGRIAERPGLAGAARLTVAYTIATARPRLGVRVTVETAAERPIAYGIGFHPYLAVPAAARDLAVAGGGERFAVGAAIDAKYPCTAGVFELSDGARPLWRIEAATATTLGLWKIDAAKAAAIADLPDDADPRFVCVNPIAFGQSLAAGESRSHAVALEPQPALFD